MDIIQTMNIIFSAVFLFQGKPCVNVLCACKNDHPDQFVCVISKHVLKVQLSALNLHYFRRQ